jgi:hypothetical protein
MLHKTLLVLSLVLCAVTWAAALPFVALLAHGLVSAWLASRSDTSAYAREIAAMRDDITDLKAKVSRYNIASLHGGQ